MNKLALIQDVMAKATCLYTKADVEAAIAQVAATISERLAAANPVVICVLKGGIPFTGMLLPLLKFPLQLDYAHATRYQGATEGAELFWKAKPQTELANRTVLLIDDILDGGVTLQALVDYCNASGAQEVLSAVLVDKPAGRIPEGLAQADFVGLTVEDRFIIGYGLDYDEYLRNVDGIYEVAPEHH